MMLGRKSIYYRLIALFLVVCLATPCYVNAAAVDTVQPRASYYLDSYNTYICNMGGGRMEIWFSVTGTNYMDEIGTLSIMLYESIDNKNWTWVKTYLHEDFPSMLAYDDFVHSSCVSYSGIPGRYYKAYVCIWAGRNGGGDSRYMWAIMV